MSQSLSTGPAFSQSAAKRSEERLWSLDAYRGLIMVALAFNGFGLAATSKIFLELKPEDRFWQSVHYTFSHVEWEGCSFWDMIQPSFMFMVGVSMAYSYVKRQARGDSWMQMCLHALTRSLVLILLGVFLSSTDAVKTNWVFMNVLSQIGLGYPFLFLMWGRTRFQQWMIAGCLLAITWAAYTYYPQCGLDPKRGDESVGVKAEWAQKHLSDVTPAWHKNANVGHAIDVQVLNLFPRKEPFKFNAGGYQTINFVPSLATMLIGLICGEILRSTWTDRRKMLQLIMMGVALLALGLVLQSFGIALVKRIWTPSWAMFSTGICSLILAVLYGIIDVAGCRTWSKFLVIVGMNSIAIYMMSQLLKGWTERQLRIHILRPMYDTFRPLYEMLSGGAGREWLDWLGLFEPVLISTSVGMVFWLVCYWMARNKIFVRV